MKLIPSTGHRWVLLSAELSDFTASENYTRHLRLVRRLSNTGIGAGPIASMVQCHGVYHGEHETSLAVLVPVTYVRHLEAIARAFDQESILVIDPRGDGELRFCNYDPERPQIQAYEPIGHYQPLDQSSFHGDHTRIVGTPYGFTFA